jgi:hypothetical protein
MKVLTHIALHDWAWSLRRLHVPVSKNALVLEVGSGDNPYPRANVLVDAYDETRQRHWMPLVADRPTVLAYVENLPFRDKVFDFVIASHVLEHSAKPELFLPELQRVARAGYIETPHAFFERIIPYMDHRLEVSDNDGRLLIRKKRASEHDPETAMLYRERLGRNKKWVRFIAKNAFDFHVRYYWSDQAGGIQYDVLNPEMDASWPPVVSAFIPPSSSLRAKVRARALKLVRWLFSQRQRNRQIDLLSLLWCPACRQGDLSVSTSNQLCCMGCRATFPMRAGVPILTAWPLN